jgi:allantoicase
MGERDLSQLNSLSSEEAEAEFLKCCGSRSWARQVAAKRPFSAVNDLLKSSEDVWWSLESDDWLEAFRSHPRIGEQKAAQSTGAAAQKWSQQEQAAVQNAAENTKSELARLNLEYEKRFGFIFIVCATGKSSDEMLSLLKERLSHTRDQELRIAATEQAKITALRINKLLNL